MTTHHKGALFVLAAALIYAGFSSPTPDTLGIPEILVFLFLIGAATCIRTVTHTSWTIPFSTLLIYGISVPLIIGTLSGYLVSDIARDLIAFLVLAIPVVFGSFYKPDDQRTQFYLFLTLISVGLIFALRYLVASADMLTSLGISAISHDFLYLANSPLVAFAGAGLLLHGSFREEKSIYAIAFILLSLLPIAAMIGMMQRATLALLAVAWIGFFIHTLIVNPKRALITGASLIIFILCLWPLPQIAMQSLIDKTWNVGWNARGSELSVLLDSLNTNIFTAMFGTGWGSLMKSPAVGELWVRFSHAFITSMLWKTGWAGLILSIVAVGALIIDILKRFPKNQVTAASLLLAAMPSLFLYGSYKSLCFGLLLLGIGHLNWTRSLPKC